MVMEISRCRKLVLPALMGFLSVLSTFSHGYNGYDSLLMEKYNHVDKYDGV